MKKLDKEELHSIFLGMESNREFYFNKLYKKYGKLVYAIAFSILNNRENSEDVMQKVYTKIWNMDKQKLPKSNEASWLYSLTKNETLDFIKYQKNSLNIEEVYYISEENKEINEIIDKDSYNRIISKLDINEQEIISLKILSNLSFKEISQVLNIPEGTVKWKYYKSIHTLKLLLGNLGMFIITFTIGLKTVFANQKKASQVEEKSSKDENIPNSSTTSTEMLDTDKSKNQIENETEEIIQEPVNINKYYEIGILGVSSMFLIFTIIFTIIFIKHQLKRKQKSSK